MEMSFCTPLQLQHTPLWNCGSKQDQPCGPLAYDGASDLGYFSTTGSLSPTSSVDSSSFSPSSMQAVGGCELDVLDCFEFSSPAVDHVSLQTQAIFCPAAATPSTGMAGRRSRSRYPGKKRHTASEREKLRMRDLTKALQHLRTYLPPSVAPAGQTLTKIETLRLTLRYISYLSDCLGLSEEVLQQRRIQGSVEEPQSLSQVLGQEPASYGPLDLGYEGLDCFPQRSIAASQLPPVQNPYQVSGEFCYSPCDDQQYWASLQQPMQNVFSGLCLKTQQT